MHSECVVEPIESTITIPLRGSLMSKAMSPLHVLSLSFALLAGATLSAQVPQGGAPSGPPRTISVTGSGEVRVPISEASIQVVINVDGNDIEAAKKEEEKVMKDVKGLIARLGIGDDQVDIAYLDITPQQQYSEDYPGIVQRYKKNGDNDHPKPTGYDASRRLLITLKDLSRVEELQQGLVKMEQVSVGDIQFRGPDMDAQRDKARLLAIRNARDKANAMAGELGVKVGRPISISEFPTFGGGDSFQSYISTMMAMATMKGDGHDTTNHSFREVPVSAQVSVVFELE
jgi:uncharacterized protein YggE